ncbi:enoyl-CoA hydratase/isomerase family protein [Desulfobotulus sp.]|jgi:enoyl-CoA hydratase/carnithine racemase|uniref:enoyl-CoA hydratase/isomerase family protein n=1 Tax=Desulfobotulus sp. TaxID=1940337 RepID=UPI002A369C50|nr:enoyl-CoA hydratase/isomerase family protein [Desulfobotulus sp.]MDY0162494.1 enoyl-CoA hydratase/isomerase family protein [Desulfobotulus sp.]
MKTLNFRQAGRIGYLTLNRPDKYNAFDLEMMDEFEAFLQARRYDNETGVIILDGGASRGFCAGLDVETYAPAIMAMSPVDAYNAQARLSRLFLAMRRIPQPIISCVHGAAAGIGFSLAMASDIRILADTAKFSAAYINIGLGGADMSSSYFLPRLIGAGRAYEYLLTGNWMDADTAMALGFASRKVSREALIETAEGLAKTMMEKNPMGIRMTKEAINANLDVGGLEAALQMEDRNQMMIAYTYRMTSPS